MQPKPDSESRTLTGGEAKIQQYIHRIQKGADIEDVLRGIDSPTIRSAVEAGVRSVDTQENIVNIPLPETRPVNSVSEQVQHKHDAARLDTVRSTLGLRPAERTHEEQRLADNEKRLLKDLESAINELITAEIIWALSPNNDSITNTLNEITLSTDEVAFLSRLKVTYAQHASQYTIDTLDVRQFIFRQIGLSELRTYDALFTRVLSTSVFEEVSAVLTNTEQDRIPEATKQAREIFDGLVDGEEFNMDLSLTNAERQVLIDLNIGSKRLDYVGEAVKDNFIKKIILKIARGEIIVEKPQPVAIRRENPVRQQEQSKNWEDVVRISDQEAFGDLNGSYEGFMAHLLQRGLIEVQNTRPVWKGGNKRVVFVGDIMGDREGTGFMVMEALVDLHNQAVQVGGSVESLAGNHDNMSNAILGGFNVENKPAADDYRIFEYAGNLESAFYADATFKKYIIDKFRDNYKTKQLDIEEAIAKKDRIIKAADANPGSMDSKALETYRLSLDAARATLFELEDIHRNIQPDDARRFSLMLKFLSYKDSVSIGQTISRNNTAILHNMRNNPAGLKKLEAACGQKLATFHDDTLYTHTNLTHEMVQEITKGQTIAEGIEMVNNLYRKGLRFFLLGEGALSDEEKTNFDKLRLLFLSTSRASRVNYSEDTRLNQNEKESDTTLLRSRGVNLVIHGHNDEGGTVKGESDLPIVSIDRSVYKGSESWGKDKPVATLSVDTKGNVRSAEAGQTVRART